MMIKHRLDVLVQVFSKPCQKKFFYVSMHVSPEPLENVSLLPQLFEEGVISRRAGAQAREGTCPRPRHQPTNPEQPGRSCLAKQRPWLSGVSAKAHVSLQNHWNQPDRAREPQKDPCLEFVFLWVSFFKET